MCVYVIFWGKLKYLSMEDGPRSKSCISEAFLGHEWHGRGFQERAAQLPA